MVSWIVIRYIFVVGTNRSRVRIFTEAITVTIKSITLDMVMMTRITIRFIIPVRNSRIAIRIYVKVVDIIIVIIFVSVRVIFMTKVIIIVIIINCIIRKSVIEGCYALCRAYSRK